MIKEILEYIMKRKEKELGERKGENKERRRKEDKYILIGERRKE